MSGAGERGRACADAWAGAALLALDPEGLGGAILRGPPSNAREAWLDALRAMLPDGAPFRKISPSIDDERLLGGLDLAATLAAERPVASLGVLAESDGGAVVLAMAERCAAGAGARIASVMDAGAVAVERDGVAIRNQARFLLIALDEAAEDEERCPASLAERLALHLDFTDARSAERPPATRGEIERARARLAHMPPPDDRAIEAICSACASFGIGSPRAALFMLRAVRAAAALAGRDRLAEEDWAVAARLVLSPRAMAPAPEAPESDPTEASLEERDGDAVQSQARAETPGETIVDAVKSSLPRDFLVGMLERSGRARGEPRARGAGAQVKSARRGRPAGARPGTLRAGERLDLIATLRAAAPWQSLRRTRMTRPSDALILVRRGDFRIRRHVQRREATTIFVVDASGSTALQRLAETKGAVETLLIEAYVTRTRVALIAFRDRAADILLPPTRSLARAKRSLADLPGGGATPLVAAIDAASLLAQSERAKGRTPLIVFLSDGRGNVGRGGEVGRSVAEADAVVAARALRATGITTVFIDTAPRARPGVAVLAAEMGAAYAPLPRVDAAVVADIVRAHAPSRR